MATFLKEGVNETNSAILSLKKGLMRFQFGRFVEVLRAAAQESRGPISQKLKRG
jgi:hypothetical protein